jgi:hypothetical protein
MDHTSIIKTTNEQKRTTITQKEKQEYMEIGRTKMNKNNNLKSGDSPWGDWIRTYAGPTPNSKDTLACWLRETQIINTRTQTARQN